MPEPEKDTDTAGATTLARYRDFVKISTGRRAESYSPVNNKSFVSFFPNGAYKGSPQMLPVM